MKKITLVLGIIWALHIAALGQELQSGKKISLQFENVPIATVLNMLAQKYDLNLVFAGDVESKISIKLDNVALQEALRAILTANGLNYYLIGDIIVVKPVETSAVGETVPALIKLAYISPNAAMNATADLLSPKGKMKVVEDATSVSKGPGAPNPTELVIVDYPDVVQKVTDFIKEMDKPEPLVAIQVRMIEMNVDGEKKTGFNWPTSLNGRLHGIENTSSTGSSVTTNATEALGAIDLPDGKWEWGKLSVAEVALVLDFLEKSGNSKLISDPRITTLNNHQAEIKVATVVPIQTINRFSEGGAVQDIVTFQDEEVGISLQVTPRITDSNQIMLDVYPTVAEIIGFSGPEGNQKPITSERSIRTKITVQNGETAALGGLLKESKIENEQKVFFLGSIPILGNLFKHKTVKTSTTDLLILITPTVISY